MTDTDDGIDKLSHEEQWALLERRLREQPISVLLTYLRTLKRKDGRDLPERYRVLIVNELTRRAALAGVR